LTAGTSYTVTIGAGGAGAAADDEDGVQGSNSSSMYRFLVTFVLGV
jgi:hypothetical protein